MKVIVLKPQAGIEPTPSHQVESAGGRDLPASGFALKSKYPGAGIISTLSVAVGPVLGPKSYYQALMSLDGPGKANFSCPAQELNPSPQEMPCVNQGIQEPARLLVGLNPGPPEMPSQPGETGTCQPVKY
ncbi:hypothetical protein DSO57_1016425 [Entomophthora muscae]|uniref:Uncharacterized protein n=1 Tax=Entomophthora muscae TaxID=34485 RepID=A0ACC2SHT2_9FUNG|nr:hypothetical protein DSO57_1016425 [Entomophthora muscae]